MKDKVKPTVRRLVLILQKCNGPRKLTSFKIFPPDRTAKEPERDPCASPPCKRLKQGRSEAICGNAFVDLRRLGQDWTSRPSAPVFKILFFSFLFFSAGQLSFPVPVTPQTSQNGTSSSVSSPPLTSYVNKADHDLRPLTEAGGLVIGAPSPQDQHKTTSTTQNALASPSQVQSKPSASQLDSPNKSPEVQQINMNSSKSPPTSNNQKTHVRLQK